MSSTYIKSILVCFLFFEGMWLIKLKLFNLGGGGISGVRLQTLQIVQGIVIDTKRFSFFLAMDDLTTDYFGQSHGIILTHAGDFINISDSVFKGNPLVLH